ncbi:MAG: hypothetical protein ACR2NY_00490 [Alphaproteobacteria bacterium]
MFDNDLLFYRGMKVILVSQIFLLGLLFFFDKIINQHQNTKINQLLTLAPLKPHIIAIVLVGASINVCFHSVVPTIIDRSISVFLLGFTHNLEKNNQTANIDNWRQGFDKIYADDYQAIERRLEEQIRSGNVITTSNGTIMLTNKGKQFLIAAAYLNKLLGIDNKHVNPPVDKLN